MSFCGVQETLITLAFPKVHKSTYFFCKQTTFIFRYPIYSLLFKTFLCTTSNQNARTRNVNKNVAFWCVTSSVLGNQYQNRPCTEKKHIWFGGLLSKLYLIAIKAILFIQESCITLNLLSYFYTYFWLIIYLGLYTKSRLYKYMLILKQVQN